MHISSFILANDTAFYKLVGLVIVVIIWGLGGLASAAKKASEQARRCAAMRTPVSPPVTQTLSSPGPAQRKAAPAARKPAAAPRRPPPPPRVPAGFERFAMPNVAAKAQAPARRPAAVPLVAKVAPPVPRPAAAPSPIPISRLDAQTAAQHGVSPVAVRAVPHGSNSSAIRQWLRPASLRKQFIITELLQPPMALRQTHETRADDSQQRHRN